MSDEEIALYDVFSARMETHFQRLRERLNVLSALFDRKDERFDRLEARFDRLDLKLDRTAGLNGARAKWRPTRRRPP